MGLTESTLPTVSVVVPTFNRLARLRRVLDALAAQEFDRGQLEVIVVSDGCTDGTDDYLRSATPLPIVHAAQDNAGPAAARNHGIRLARGRLVLFIDDDVLASPQLVQRHVDAHGDSASTVVIGPMLNAPGFRYTPWVAWEQAMLYKQYHAMRVGEYEATFRQFFTGNASVPRELLLRAGGFDTTFRRAEDVELSYRLDQLGARFVFEERAAGHHLAERSFESWLAAADAYGKNDVRFARDHDQEWLLPKMAKEFRERNRLTQTLVGVCITRPRLTRATTRALSVVAKRRHSLPRLTNAVLSGLYGMTYYCAAATESGNRRQFKASLFASSPQAATAHA